MFYSHEILTDRKHGVATIWLVATLGSRSMLRKVSRKAIMDVHVPSACETITDPQAPLALRLQSCLLYGVTRVFQQQCTYMLTDTQNLKEKMRSVAVALSDLATDPDVSATRLEQLNLPINPSFNVDLDLSLDLSIFDLSFSSSEPSSFLSPNTLASSQTSFAEDEEGGEVFLQELPPAATHSDIDIGHGYMQNDDAIADDNDRGQDATQIRQAPDSVHDVVEEDMFELLPDGTLDYSSHQNSDGVGGFEPADPDNAVNEYELDLNLGEDVQDALPIHAVIEDGDPALLINDEPVSADGDQQAALAPRPADGDSDDNAVPTIEDVAAGNDGNMNDGGAEEFDDEDVATGIARQERKRPTQGVPVDNPTQIPNRTLSDWQNNYLNIMNVAVAQKEDNITLAQAKRNAARWVLDGGVSGLDQFALDLPMEHPLAVLSGQRLITAFTSREAVQTPRKRSSSAVTEDQTSEVRRRVRARSEVEYADIGNNDDSVGVEDQPGIFLDDLDDDEIEPEMGRRGEEPLPDHHDSMPWNTYAASSSKQTSRQGSIRPFMSAAGASSSVGGRGGFSLGPGNIAPRRISRLVPESPLEHRHRLMRQSSVAGSARLDSDNLDDIWVDLGYDNSNDYEVDRLLAANPGDITNFELPFEISTQDANNSQVIAKLLEQEAQNFLGFVSKCIRAKQAELEDTQEAGSVTFEELIPGDDKRKDVASQGLLHVLSLATQDLIHVRQDEHFGDIHISIVEDELDI